jgi:hypothetical protein
MLLFKTANGPLSPKETENLSEWWTTRICQCLKFKLPTDYNYGWWRDRNARQAPDPAQCRTCNKWARSGLHRCDLCGDLFYKQYRTRLMPLAWDKSMCWSCLHSEGLYPSWTTHPWFETYQDAKPPDCVIQPIRIFSEDELDDLFSLR